MKKLEDLFEPRKMVADFTRRLYERGLTTSGGGNISLRVGDKILITPSKFDKGRLQPENIGIMLPSGENLTPHLKLSIETEMHLCILKTRCDVNAVVHAHPPTASAFAVTKAGLEMDTDLTDESAYLLGKIARSKYAGMGTAELAQNVAQAVKNSNVVLMENHGALCVGANLLEAFERMEVLENTAKMNFIIFAKMGYNQKLGW